MPKERSGQKRKGSQDDPEQAKRFIDTAKELGASEDPKDFDKAFQRVTDKKPKP